MRSQRFSLKSIVLPVMAAIAATTFFPDSSIKATIMQRLEVEELARNSTDVFHGQVVSTQTYWNAERTRIYTGVNVRLNEIFKGLARRGETVRVVQLGGEKDGFKTDYAGRPEFTTGESVVLFTTRTRNNELTVVGLKQGKMLVNGQSVTRDFSGLALMELSKSGRELQPLKISSMQLTLNELRRRIAKSEQTTSRHSF